MVLDSNSPGEVAMLRLAVEACRPCAPQVERLALQRHRCAPAAQQWLLQLLPADSAPRLAVWAAAWAGLMDAAGVHAVAALQQCQQCGPTCMRCRHVRRLVARHAMDLHKVVQLTMPRCQTPLLLLCQVLHL